MLCKNVTKSRMECFENVMFCCTVKQKAYQMVKVIHFTMSWKTVWHHKAVMSTTWRDMGGWHDCLLKTASQKRRVPDGKDQEGTKLWKKGFFFSMKLHGLWISHHLINYIIKRLWECEEICVCIGLFLLLCAVTHRCAYQQQCGVNCASKGLETWRDWIKNILFQTCAEK